MDKIIPNGTEVLIFNYRLNQRPKIDEELYVKGIVESSEILEEEDEIIQGKPWRKRFYKVLGEDNDIYYATYGFDVRGSHFIRTVEDHINHIKNKIKSNEEEIKNLNEDNIKLYNLMTHLIIYEKNKTQLKPVEHLGEEAANIHFNSLDDKVTTLAKLNVKRYNRNKLIKKQ